MNPLSVLVICLIATASAQTPPNKPVWPAEFDVAFGLNVPAVAGLNDNIINGSSHFYYNWDELQDSVIVYEDFCIPGLYNGSSTDACILYFNSQGTFLSQPKAGIECCLLFSDVGSVPPNFLAPFNYSTDTIAFDYYGVPDLVHFWTAPSGFQYWTAENQFGSDIQFCDGGNVLWNFAPLNVAPQPKDIFQLPDNCASSCGPPSAMNPKESRDPMIRMSAMHAGLW